MKQSLKKHKHLALLIVPVVIIVLLALILLLWLAHWVSQPETQAEIQSWVSSLGWLGVLVMLLLQMLQVIITIIPGEVFEFMAGVLYGGLGGLIICVIGCFLATLIVFNVSRRFGKTVLRSFLEKRNLSQYKFLQDTRKQETVIFVLFLIPGIPKDILSYISGATSPMKPLSFSLLATTARIPAIAGATFIGSNLIEGNWVIVVILFVIIAAGGLLGIHFKERILAFAQKLGKKKEE